MLYATIKIFAVLSAILLDEKLAQLMRSEVGVALKLIRSIFESFETGVFVTCEVTAGATVVVGGSVVVVGGAVVVVVVVGVVVVVVVEVVVGGDVTVGPGRVNGGTKLVALVVERGVPSQFS